MNGRGRAGRGGRRGRRGGRGGAAERRAHPRGVPRAPTNGPARRVVKFAASLDGRIAASSGDSRWVSGPQTLAWAHRNRPRLDAIVVGSGLVVIDDPQLTARPEGEAGAVHQPLRVVLDARGRTPAALARTATRRFPAHRHHRGVTRGRSAIDVGAGAEVLVLPSDDSHVDLRALLAALGARGALTVLFEGGERRRPGSRHRPSHGGPGAGRDRADHLIGAASALGRCQAGRRRMAQALRLRTSRSRASATMCRSRVPVWPEVVARAEALFTGIIEEVGTVSVRDGGVLVIDCDAIIEGRSSGTRSRSTASTSRFAPWTRAR
ncbi:MAG: RibD family protein [Dehalococcoidia bacterium]